MTAEKNPSQDADKNADIDESAGENSDASKDEEVALACRAQTLQSQKGLSPLGRWRPCGRLQRSFSSNATSPEARSFPHSQFLRKASLLLLEESRSRLSCVVSCAKRLRGVREFLPLSEIGSCPLLAVVTLRFRQCRRSCRRLETDFFRRS